MRSLPTDDPLAVEAVAAIHTGEVATLRQLLTAHQNWWRWASAATSTRWVTAA